jgi:hypothetical protein
MEQRKVAGISAVCLMLFQKGTSVFFFMPNEAHRLRMPENEVVKYYLKLREEEKRQNGEECVQRKSIQGSFSAVGLYCII